MIKVSFENTYSQIGEYQIPLNSLYIKSDERYGKVSLYIKAEKGDCIIRDVHYSEFKNESNEPYTSLADLLTDLQQNFTDQDPSFTKGTTEFTADGETIVLLIPHNLGSVPSQVLINNLKPLTQSLLSRTITKDATNIIVTYSEGNPPVEGEDATYDWVAYR